MMEYLLQSLPRILFEPLAVGAFLWIITSLFLFRRKREPFFRIIVLAVCIMLAWRLCLHTLMLSGRYSAFLIYPATIFTVCFCFKLNTICRWLLMRFDKKHIIPCRNLICRIIPWLFMIGLSIAGIVKSLNFNPYDTVLPETCRFYRELPGEKNNPVQVDADPERFGYYSSTPLKQISRIPKNDKISIEDQFRNRLQRLKNQPGDHYFFFYLRKKDAEPTVETLGLKPGDGKWEILKRSFVSKRKNKELLLARFTAGCPNMKEWNGPVPSVTAKNNFCVNGDFEQLRPQKQQEARKAALKAMGITVFDEHPEKYFPYAWWLSYGAWFKDKPQPDMYVSAKNPIAGAYSLFVDSTKTSYGSAFNSRYVYLKNGAAYSLFVRNEAETPSLVILTFVTKGKDEKRIWNPDKIFFEIPPGKLYQISGTFPAPTDNSHMTCIHFTVKGKVVIDQVVFQQ